VAVPILYSNTSDPLAMRARLALLCTGIRCELREVDPARKPAQLLALSRRGALPLLQLADDKLFDDSLAIMRWAAAMRPELGLWPELRVRQQAIENLVRIIDGPFAEASHRYGHPASFPGRHALDHRAEAEIFLAQLEARLARVGSLVGEHETLADLAILPFIHQFAEVDRTWFDISPYRQLRAWLARYRDNPHWQQCQQSFPLWQPGAEPRYLEPAGSRRASA
jgi:glutathione S-transferase